MRQPTKPPRPTYTSEERAQWISRYRSSGLTQLQFAQQQGVKLKTLRAWLYRQRRRRGAAPLPQKTTAPKRRPTSPFREFTVPPLWSGSGWVTEVTWPSGVTVRLGARAEATWIEALLGAVRLAC